MMLNPECFGLEFYDSGGSKCPHMECILREDCEKVYDAAEGLVHKRNERLIREEYKKTQKIEKDLDKKINYMKESLYPETKKERKKGYKKPGKILYKDEGTIRDKFLSRIRKCLTRNSYRVKATKCIHSFDRGGEYLLKIDTRRKKSILVFVRDELSDALIDKDIKCRGLYDSERANYPIYLSWVAKISSETDMNKLMESIISCYSLK